MTEKDIRAIVKGKQLSEEHARSLAQKEKDGRGRQFVLKIFAAQARKAKRRRNLKEAISTV